MTTSYFYLKKNLCFKFILSFMYIFKEKKLSGKECSKNLHYIAHVF